MAKKRKSTSDKKNSTLKRTNKLRLALEPRILYDASGLAAGLDIISDGTDIGDHALDNADQADTVESSISIDSISEFIPPAVQNVDEIVFVDPGVRDYSELIKNIDSDATVIVLDPDKDGISQITDILSGYENISSVHILSHGNEAGINLGSVEFNSDVIDFYSSSLKEWKNSLTEDADILIYGCDVAKGEEGSAFISKIADLTGADIAASTDTTGIERLGGDWDLEYQTGDIEADTPFDPYDIEAYDDVLAGLEYADLNNWTAEGDSSADWEIEEGGRTVVQHYNGSAMFFLSDDAAAVDIAIQGTLLQSDTDFTTNYSGDGDIMGYVFGYQDSSNYYVFEWSGPDSDNDMYLYKVTNGSKTILDEYHDLEWTKDVTYDVRILYMSNTIKVSVDGVNYLEASGTFAAGKFGFYNYSQGAVQYGNVRTAPGSLVEVVPEVSNDTYGVDENTTINIDRFSGLLSNDYDPNLDVFTLTVNGTLLNTDDASTTFDTAHGQATVYGDGHFSYTPDNDYTGSDTFIYYLTDDDGNSYDATVTLNIMEPNVAPTDITIDCNTVESGVSDGTVIGALSTTDGNTDDAHDYMLIDNSGGRFGISGNNITVADGSLISEGSYNITVRTTDLRGLSYDEVITIEVADGAPTITTTDSSSVWIEDGAAVIIAPDLTITDAGGENIESAKVTINNKINGDILSFIDQNGITGDYDSSTGVLTLTGSASISSYQTALRSITFKSSVDEVDTTSRDISFTIGSAISSSDTGHYYEYIDGTYTWSEAKAAAEARTLYGLQGYLATITSLEENTYIQEKLQADAWIGASDQDTEGVWKWVTGPEAGTIFYMDPDNFAENSGTVTWDYWNSGEPNDSDGNEHYAEIYSSGSNPGMWNDLPDSWELGYVVEYGGTAGDPVLQLTATKTVNILSSNDAPVLSGLTSKTVDENAAASVIDADITFSDVDSSDLDGGTVTVSGLDAEDIVSIASGVSHSAGAVQRSGNEVQISDGSSWTTIGTIGTDADETGAGETLVITLNSNADPANVDALLQSLTFYNNDDTPATARTLSITVTDGDGGTTGAQNVSISITPANDAPSVETPGTITITDTDSANIYGDITGTVNASDAEGSSLIYGLDAGVVSGGFSILAGTYGTLTIDTATGDYVYTPDNDAVNGLDSGITETFTATVSDGSVSSNTTITVDINAVPESVQGYVEQDSAITPLINATITTEGDVSYSGGYMDFEVNDSESSETIGLIRSDTASIVNGAVTIVGNAVYLGDGTTAKVIGSVDGTLNGENGQKLRINFSVDFENGDFEVGANGDLTVVGWTIVNDRVIFGQDQIAGQDTPIDATYPANNLAKTVNDNGELEFPDGIKDIGNLDSESYSTTVISGAEANGGTGNSIKMNSNLNSADGYEVIRGPYIYSNGTVALEAGDSVSFYWKAEGGGDAYDVYGYIVNVNTGETQVILDETGSSTSATTNWAQESVSVANAGEYRFVFVSGSYDYSGGEAMGAQLYIDDVQVTQANPPDGVSGDALEQIAKLVTYENSSDLTAANGTISKTMTVTAVQADNTSGSSAQAIEITEVNDVPSVVTPSVITITDTDSANIFGDITGTVNASDLDAGTVLTYGLDSGTVSEGYSTLTGTYGTLSINTATGEYVYTPDSDGINALSSDANDLFTVTVSDGTATSTTTLTVDIDAVPESVQSYVEQDPAITPLSNSSITAESSVSYSGGYMDFEVSDSESGETIGLIRSDTASIVNGMVSIVGNAVYLGDGTTAKVIGSVDGTLNGENGQKLRINFSVDFENGDFEVGSNGDLTVVGWTIVNDRVIFGQDQIAGQDTPIDSTYPAYNGTLEDSSGGSGSYDTTVISGAEANGGTGNSIRMHSSLHSNSGYAVMRGPYIYSNGTVALEAGDSVSFYWKAEGGSDAYDVYGYIVNVNTGEVQVILDETGGSTYATTNWAQESISVASAGEYRFVFVSGSYDYTGGRALGAQLYIDDVQVTQANPPDGVSGDALEQIAKLVTYENSSDLSAANGTISKTMTVTTVQADNTSASSTQAIEITEVNDVPVIEGINITYTDSGAADNFASSTGTLNASDVDSGTVLTYDISGGTDNGDGTVSIIGSYGTLTLNQTTGAYEYTPDDSAINLLNTDASDTFTLSVSDGEAVVTETFTVNAAGINETPVITTGSASNTIQEDTSLVFGINGDNSISLDDLDAAPDEELVISLNVGNGTVILGSTTGITVTGGADSSGSIEIKGTLTNLNAALEGLTYRPGTNYNGSDILTITVDDRFNTGNGSAETVIKTVDITVDAVNDIPVLDTPDTVNITDTSSADIFGDITGTASASDVDAGTTLVYGLDGGVISGGYSSVTGAYGTITINTATGEYVFSPDNEAVNNLDAGSSETFAVTVTDGDASVSKNITINIQAMAESASEYTEQGDAVTPLSNVTINTESGTSYAGGYVDFEVSGSESSETLGLVRSDTASVEAGVVTIVGNTVYLGGGTNAEVIGSVDSLYNGENGQKLRIKFTTEFENGNFEQGSAGDITVTGWTMVNERVVFGQDQIAGQDTPADSTYPVQNLNKTVNDSGQLEFPDGIQDAGNVDYAAYTSSVVSGSVANGGTGNAIEMRSSLNSADGYEVIRGPYIYSNGTVALEAGDQVSFYWKAEGGSDAYDVYGYIIDVNTGAIQTILDDTAPNARTNTPWTQESVTVSSSGEYRFVFVSGSFDATGGEAMGAQLYIDDVEVTQANPPDSVTGNALQQIARLVTYENSSDLTAANGTINKAITVTAVQADNTADSAVQSLEITEVNDAPVLDAPGTVYYTDTDGSDSFASSTGVLSASDADSGTVITYGITDGTDNGDGTESITGSYGTLTLNTSTGAWEFTPDDAAINALTSNVTETFTLSAGDGETSDSQTLTIDISSVNDAPLLGGNASTVTFIENGSAVQIDPTISITDFEGTSYDTGHVTFSTVVNGESSDSFVIKNVGGITVSGNEVSYGGMVIGTIDSDYNGENGSDLRINLNSNAYSPQVEALARAVAFVNSADDLSDASRTVSIQVNDGGNGGESTARYSTKSATVQVNEINDIPVIDTGDSLLATEKVIGTNPDGSFVIEGLSVSDADNGIVTVVFSTSNAGNGSYAALTLSTAVEGGITEGDITGNGTGEVTVTASVDAINATLAAVNGLTYSAGAGNDFVAPGPDTLTITASDAESGSSVSQQQVIVMPAVPNADSDNMASREDTIAVIDLGGLVTDINDNGGTYVFGTGTPDDSDGNGGSLTPFSGNEIYSEYDLNNDGVAGNDVIGYRLEHGEIRLTDATKYIGEGQDFAEFTFTPDENWSGVQTFLYQYTSGGSQSSYIAQIAFYVAPVNDAPVVNIDSSSGAINEDGSLVFGDGGSNFLSFTDVDAESDDLLDLSLSVENGTINLASTAGLTFLSGSDGTGRMVIRGTLADLTAATEGFTYNANSDFNGTDTLDITLNDGGNSGSGGALSYSQSVDISISAVDDAPDISSSIPDINVSEDAENVTIDLTSVFTDRDNDDAFIEKTIFSNSNPELAGVTINGNILTIDPNADIHGSATIVLRGTSNGQTVDETFTINVAPVNDTPVVNDFSFEVDEDTPCAIDGWEFSDPQEMTADTPDFITILNIDDLNGTLKLNNEILESGSTVAWEDRNDIIFLGDYDYYGNASFTYSVTDRADINPGTALTSEIKTVTINVRPVEDPVIGEETDAPSGEESDGSDAAPVDSGSNGTDLITLPENQSGGENSGSGTDLITGSDDSGDSGYDMGSDSDTGFDNGFDSGFGDYDTGSDYTGDDSFYDSGSGAGESGYSSGSAADTDTGYDAGSSDGYSDTGSEGGDTSFDSGDSTGLGTESSGEGSGSSFQSEEGDMGSDAGYETGDSDGYSDTGSEGGDTSFDSGDSTGLGAESSGDGSGSSFQSEEGGMSSDSGYEAGDSDGYSDAGTEDGDTSFGSGDSSESGVESSGDDSGSSFQSGESSGAGTGDSASGLTDNGSDGEGTSFEAGDSGADNGTDSSAGDTAAEGSDDGSEVAEPADDSGEGDSDSSGSGAQGGFQADGNGSGENDTSSSSGTGLSGGSDSDDSASSSIEVDSGINDVFIPKGETASIVIPEDAFLVQGNSDEVTFEATLSDGTALPEWIEFDPGTGNFTINASGQNINTDTIDISVTALDKQGNSATTIFRIVIDGDGAESGDSADPGVDAEDQDTGSESLELSSISDRIGGSVLGMALAGSLAVKKGMKTGKEQQKENTGFSDQIIKAASRFENECRNFINRI